MHFIQSPEFWSSSAFILSVVIMGRPVGRLLKKWGQKQADGIKKQQEEALDVLKKAEALEAEYKTLYQKRNQERRKVMREADREIQFLKQDLLKQTHDRIARKNQEVDLRLNRIAENGRQDIKRKMLSRLIKQTENQLVKTENDNKGISIEKACEALENFAQALKQ